MRPDVLQIIEKQLVHKKNINANYYTTLSSIKHEVANLVCASLLTNKSSSNSNKYNYNQSQRSELSNTILSNQLINHKQNGLIVDQINNEYWNQGEKISNFCARIEIDLNNAVQVQKIAQS